MWQLGIIIEISSRKELLGPIWSLPRGQGRITPFRVLPGALSKRWCVFGRRRSLHWFLQHSRLHLMTGVESAFSMEFLFHMLLKRGSWQKWERSVQQLACQSACQLRWAGRSPVKYVGARWEKKSFANKNSILCKFIVIFVTSPSPPI